MFKKVNPKQNFPEMEREIMEYWKRDKTFEKSVNGGEKKSAYSFFDGPPFATGLPHYGHIVASLIKDVVPRYWTMRGHRVERRWGWDCHGLPIENLIEKEHNIKNKQDIEKWGVDKFNEACHNSVLRYADEWKKFIPRIGRWVDMDNDYRTMDWKYTESIWWVFSELYKKGLVYEGYKSMHICPRCETTLANFEVTQGYKNVKDLSATVKFRLKSGQKIGNFQTDENTYILAWTTTPWTLIGNVALAVGEEIEYYYIKIINSKNDRLKNGENYIFSKEYFKQFIPTPAGEPELGGLSERRYYLVEKDFNRAEAQVVTEFKGKDLVDKEYEPLFDYYSKDEKLANRENGWKIYAGGFVTTDEGTGIVHIAPAFGEDDMKMGEKYNLPFVQHVGMDGIIKKEAGEFAGTDLKPRAKNNPTEIREADLKIVKFLGEKIVHSKKYEHSYPHCWRCDTSLINYATSSWFVKVTAIKDKMIKNNREIRWVPEYIKEGRFGKWLEEARDWAVSRSRFWGAPIPVWKCGNEKCNHIEVVGSIARLKELSLDPVPETLDFHRPFIDSYHFNCSKCSSGVMTRVQDVFDCWFESGSMPYAQYHYPFENAGKFKKSFPADFIAEGLDQTRGWFYTLIVLSTALFDKPAFKNVIVNGIVQAEDGQKMSKRLKNYPEPSLLIEKYGADALRYYLLTSSVMKAENLRFSEKGVEEVLKRFILILWNAYSFFVMNTYPSADFDKRQIAMPALSGDEIKSNSLLDKWIISELNILIAEVNKQMENYDLVRASRPLREFVDKLSNWYIRRSRKRFALEDMDDRNYASMTLYYVLTEYVKLLAPFMPFLAEEMFKNLTGRESVHLEEYPKTNKNLIDRRINEKMNFVRDIVALGLAIRAKNRLKVRQPLQKLEVKIWKLMNRNSLFEGTAVKILKLEIKNEPLDLIKDELNVKEVEFVDEIVKKNGWLYEEDDKIKIGLKIEITDELRTEGYVRELVRHIQTMRKETKYNRDDIIEVGYSLQKGSENLQKVFDSWTDYIKKECLAKSVEFSGKLVESDFDLVRNLKLDESSIGIGIKK